MTRKLPTWGKCAGFVLVILTLGLAAPALFNISSAHARFELVKQWVIAHETGYFDFRPPDWPLKNGSMYLWDTSRLTPYPIWRLAGTTLTPVTGFSPAEGTFQHTITFNAGEMVVLSGRIGGEVRHWQIDGNEVIPLDARFGQVPFTGEWLWTPLESETIISGRDEPHGRELWLMDENGYRLIADLNEGPADSHPGDAGWEAVRLYDWYRTFTGRSGPELHILFTLDDGSTGSEPWAYDIAKQTLTQVDDLVAGAEGSHPWWLGNAGTYHYFGTVDGRIYKSDEQDVQLVLESGEGWLYTPYRHVQSQFEFAGNLYTWWGPHGINNNGHILRIAPDDSVRRFSARLFPHSPEKELKSVAPFDGEVQMVGGSSFLKITGDEVVPSELFSGVVIEPKILAWTENELLFEERGYSIIQDDLYCLVDGEAIPVWRKPTNIPYLGMTVYGRGDWVYVQAADSLAAQGQPGGTVQLWGMRWPNGCHEPWNDIPINAGLNDAWFNPELPGQGFFITVLESVQMMFVAWFTYDTHRPDDDVQATLGEPGHRWLTAFGPYEGNRADLKIEATSGGVFDATFPAPTQTVDGSLGIEFIGCNSAQVTFEIYSNGYSGVIPIERIATSNVPACEAAVREAD